MPTLPTHLGAAFGGPGGGGGFGGNGGELAPSTYPYAARVGLEVICRCAGVERRAQITQIGDGRIVGLNIYGDRGMLERGLPNVVYAPTAAERAVENRWWPHDPRPDLESFFADPSLGEVLKPGASGAACRNIRLAIRRLSSSDLKVTDLYDEELYDAVEHFQTIHKHPAPDGYVGPVTRSLLVQQLIAQPAAASVFKRMDNPGPTELVLQLASPTASNRRQARGRLRSMVERKESVPEAAVRPLLDGAGSAALSIDERIECIQLLRVAGFANFGRAQLLPHLFAANFPPDLVAATSLLCVDDVAGFDALARLLESAPVPTDGIEMIKRIEITLGRLRDHLDPLTDGLDDARAKLANRIALRFAALSAVHSIIDAIHVATNGRPHFPTTHKKDEKTARPATPESNNIHPAAHEKLVAAAMGAIFLGVLAYAGLRDRPIIDPGQFWFLRVVASVSAAAFAALITGFIEVEFRNFLRAGGALAVFAVIWLTNPPALVGGERRLSGSGESTESSSPASQPSTNSTAAVTPTISGPGSNSPSSRRDLSKVPSPSGPGTVTGSDSGQGGSRNMTQGSGAHLTKPPPVVRPNATPSIICDGDCTEARAALQPVLTGYATCTRILHYPTDLVVTSDGVVSANLNEGDRPEFEQCIKGQLKTSASSCKCTLEVHVN